MLEDCILEGWCVGIVGTGIDVKLLVAAVELYVVERTAVIPITSILVEHYLVNESSLIAQVYEENLGIGAIVPPPAVGKVATIYAIDSQFGRIAIAITRSLYRPVGMGKFAGNRRGRLAPTVPDSVQSGNRAVARGILITSTHLGIF